jgi:hypothetical protein
MSKFKVSDKKIEDFDMWDKFLVWHHYIVIIVALNLQIDETKFSKFKIRSYDDFINDDNELRAEGLAGHYWRFKDEIFVK